MFQVVTDFEPIVLENMPPPLETEKERDLSTDVKYLFQIANAVSSGSCSKEIANKKPGKICHSRWLTKASRLLRLYVSTNSPSESLKALATYIIKVYVPMYFNVKFYSSVVHGSTLLFKFIRTTQTLPDAHREIINTTVQNNAYFAHSENILLSMLFDDRKEVRDRAIKKILHFRDNIFMSTELRPYKKPVINFNCANYYDMIDLNDDEILSEPPLTAGIPYDYLKEYLDFDNPPLSDPNIPSHIQGTERFVQVLSNVSGRVTESNRDDVIAVTVESRTRIPRMESKKDLQDYQ